MYRSLWIGCLLAIVPIQVGFADESYDRAAAEQNARRDASEELVRIRREEAEERDRANYEREQRAREQAERERDQQQLRR